LYVQKLIFAAVKAVSLHIFFICEKSLQTLLKMVRKYDILLDNYGLNLKEDDNNADEHALRHCSGFCAGLGSGRHPAWRLPFEHYEKISVDA
jgi:hypothetical protein